MSKVEESRAILRALGLPPPQQTAIASYTVLALADMGRAGQWRRAKRRSLKIHDILAFVKQRYGKVYAENTRETVRRQVLHQFEQARIVDRNPDEPKLPTNSPRTHYALSEHALVAIRTYGTLRFANRARRFLQRQGALLEVYRAARTRHMIPLRLPSGVQLKLSPGNTMRCKWLLSQTSHRASRQGHRFFTLVTPPTRLYTSRKRFSKSWAFPLPNTTSSLI